MGRSTSKWGSGAALLTMALGTSIAGVVVAPPAVAAVHIEQYIEVPQCQPNTSQDCPQIPTVPFTADGTDLLKASFTANPNHCSDIEVRFLADGYPQSDWLRAGPGQTATNPNTFRRSGSHVLGVAARGVKGGCNTGHLDAWGGTVHLDSVNADGPGLITPPFGQSIPDDLGVH